MWASRQEPACSAAAAIPGRAPGARRSPAMALTSVDYLEPRKKRTYKPELLGLILTQPSRRSRPAIIGAAGIMVPCQRAWRKNGFNPVGWGLIKMTSLDSFKCLKTLKVGSKSYAYYSLPAAEKKG